MLSRVQFTIVKTDGVDVNQQVPEPDSKAVLSGSLGLEALPTLSGPTNNRTAVGCNLKIVFSNFVNFAYATNQTHFALTASF